MRRLRWDFGQNRALWVKSMKFGTDILWHILIDSGYATHPTAHPGGRNCSKFKMAAMCAIWDILRLSTKLIWIL